MSDHCSDGGKGVLEPASPIGTLLQGSLCLIELMMETPERTYPGELKHLTVFYGTTTSWHMKKPGGRETTHSVRVSQWSTGEGHDLQLIYHFLPVATT